MAGMRNILTALVFRTSRRKTMTRTVLQAALFAAATTLAACSSMPDWMPGSGAHKVSLTGAEEVPPVSTEAKGSGSFRIKDDGTVTGSEAEAAAALGLRAHGWHFLSAG